MIFVWIPLKYHLTCDIQNENTFEISLAELMRYTGFVLEAKTRVVAPVYLEGKSHLLLVRNWKLYPSNSFVVSGCFQSGTLFLEKLMKTMHKPPQRMLISLNTNFITFMCYLAFNNEFQFIIYLAMHNVKKCSKTISGMQLPFIQISILTVCKRLHFSSNEGMMSDW